MEVKNNKNNGYRTHDISRLISSYNGDASDYVEITEEELITNTIRKYPLLRDIDNAEIEVKQNKIKLAV